ncbi:MAG: hypothetical protein M1816_002709 [Peltula sp. TS41687]|nr:MAG: hypothetical protein M1816_002709 [Peltula sp. TS41687]
MLEIIELAPPFPRFEEDAKIIRMESSPGFLGGIINDSTFATDEVELGPKANGKPNGKAPSPKQSLRAQVLRAREAVVVQRDRVFRTRVVVHQQRNRLRFHREELGSLENKLSQALNHHLHKPTKDARRTVLGLFRELQSARDIFGPLEDDYNQVEDLLDQEEHRLARDEQRLFERCSAAFDLDQVQVQAQQAKSVHSATGSSRSDSSPQRSTLVKEYFWQLGQANLLMEKLGDLLLERSEVMEEESTRRRHGLLPPPSHTEFWEFFDKEWVQTLEELSVVEATVEQAKRMAQEEGSLAIDDSSSDASTDPTIEAEELEGSVDSWFDNPDPITVSSRERVHYWLLSVMEASPHEMRLYRLRLLLDDQFDEETFMRIILYDEPPGQELSSGSVSRSRKAYMSIYSDGRRKFLSVTSRDLSWDHDVPEVHRKYANGGVSRTPTDIPLDIWSQAHSV